MAKLSKSAACVSPAFRNLRQAISVVCLAAIVTLAAGESRAAIVNGSFETGNLSGWSSGTEIFPYYGGAMTAPNLGRLSVAKSFGGLTPTDGAYMAVIKISESQVIAPDAPVEFPNFVKANLYSFISQSVLFKEGDVLSFDYAALNHSGGGRASVPYKVGIEDTAGNWVHLEKTLEYRFIDGCVVNGPRFSVEHVGSTR